MTQAPTPSRTPAQVTTPLSGQLALSAIQMFSPDSGWGIGSVNGASERIFKTNDGGNNWQEVTPPEPGLAGSQLITAVGYFQSLETAWVSYYNTEPGLPSQPAVWRTRDGGQTWQASQPLDTTGLAETFAPSNLQFVDDQNGWMLVHVGVGMSHDYVMLYRSKDGGATWERLLDPDNEVQACYKTGMLFTNAQEGWLTGTCSGVAAGVWLYHTGDGGATWQPVQLPAPESRPDLFTNFENGCGSDQPTFLDAQTGFIAVTCEQLATDPRVTDYFLYSTRDGGKSWSPTSYPGGKLVFFDAQTGLALGKEIYSTEDGGKSWKKISEVTWEGDFDFATPQTGWAVARAGEQVALVRSDDGGQSWRLLEPQIMP
jgi:photosystem II stability/assembly factor-like uncharacterized protein